MLIEIDKTLSALPAEELPVEELVRIAEGVRDRLYDEAKTAERESSRREQERTARKARLRQEGMDYAKRELSDVDGLDSLTRWSIEQRVARTLDDITGDESADDIEDLVEDILEREGISYDDGEEDDDDEYAHSHRQERALSRTNDMSRSSFSTSKSTRCVPS